jgi:hypothetical protein
LCVAALEEAAARARDDTQVGVTVPARGFDRHALTSPFGTAPLRRATPQTRHRIT